MISNSKQDWSVGSQVKVGFMKLTVVAAKPTPGDWAPDAYILQNASGLREKIIFNAFENREP